MMPREHTGRESPANARRGFSLIEAVAAVVIIAVLVPPTLMAVRDAGVMRASPVLASRARWLAAERLEDIIADRHAPSRGYAYVQNASYPDEQSIPGFPGFSRSVSITETGPDLATPGAGYKRVTVTISWTDPRSGAASLAIDTVVTEYPS